jgi:nucleotide-binding universal stress UspA family protein
VETAGVHGLPQVEIGRFAEQRHADLIVLGRKPRSRTARLFLGDTADAVLRRSRIPCLAVPSDLMELSKMTVALDGTERGFIVYEYAAGFADACGMKLGAVTVEPRWAGEPPSLSAQVWSTRSEHLADRISARPRNRRGGDGQGAEPAAASGLHVRHGQVVEEILSEVAESDSDLLTLGFHRGGPPLVVSHTSVSRTLVHSAPCAVLTMPF